jgi:hypothetical protein
MSFKTDSASRGVVTAEARKCVGRTTIPLDNTTAKALSAVDPIPSNAAAALIQADGGTLRIRLDGSAPTSTVGQRIDDGVFFPVDVDLAGVRLLAGNASGTSAQVSYFDRP